MVKGSLDVISLATSECVRLTKWHQYISSVSLKFRACYITGQWGEFRVKNATICLHILFWYFFVVFHHKICVFIIFISFFDKVSNFCNRILTNQKRELVVSNCRRNCMLQYHPQHISRKSIVKIQPVTLTKIQALHVMMNYMILVNIMKNSVNVIYLQIF